MIVKILSTDTTEDVSASYGLRLIEQGKAVPVRTPAARKSMKKDTAKQVIQNAPEGHD